MSHNPQPPAELAEIIRSALVEWGLSGPAYNSLTPALARALGPYVILKTDLEPFGWTARLALEGDDYWPFWRNEDKPKAIPDLEPVYLIRTALAERAGP